MTDFNKFQKVTVDGYDFKPLANPDVWFDWRHSNLSFSLVHEGTGTIEYSFNAVTVHGDMIAGTPTEAIFFDNRPVNKIWFRCQADGYESVVRVEGWSR